MLVIFTDTDNDVTLKEAQEWGVQLISMPYSIGEKEIYPYEDFEVFDFKEYYDLLRKGMIPKTSAISPSKYVNYFKPFLEKGNDILYIHFSKALSGTFNAMHLALEELSLAYPERKVYTVDTKSITIGGRILVREIVRLYHENKSLDEILKWASEEVDKYATFFYAEDLKFFAKSGRVSNFAAFMGTLLDLHPIIHIDTDGKMKALTKAKGRTRSLKKIMKYVEELEDHITEHPVIIGHTDALDVALKLGEMLKSKFGSELDIEYVTVNPTAGAHCGPSSVGVSFHTKCR